MKISTIRSFEKGSSKTKDNNRTKGQGKTNIKQGKVVVTVARTMKLPNVARSQALALGVGQWTMPSRIAQLYQIKATGTSSSDKQLFSTNHQFKTRLGSLSSSSKADSKFRFKMLVLHSSKIEMHKEGRIRHRTCHSSKDGHII